jgi:AhpD family alkylhydroperoxidase
MKRWLLGKLLEGTRRYLDDVNMDYAWHLREVNPSRLWRFSLIKAVEGPRRITPPAVWHAAGLAAAMVEDCGPCIQIHVNLALRDGVDATMLRALVEGNVEAAPADIALAFRYGDAVARGIPAQEWRDRIRARWGEKGLIELAFTIATARFYPAVKRGMGYAQACERVMVGDQATQALRAA